ncbi:MAG: flagellar protein FlaG [Lachnospiraceae bacterium]|nr:flagellar protein FlaG [Lachnospiraceae bacterium]
MSIEPVNSAMTLQAQPVQSAQAARPATPVEKPAAEFKEAAAQDAAKAVDNKTVIVDSAGKTDTEGEGSQQTGGEASQKQLKEAVKDLHKKLDNSNNEVMFGVHEATKRVTIKIVDKDTKEVVKEFPPEKTLDMIAKVWEMAGILVDEKR